LRGVSKEEHPVAVYGVKKLEALYSSKTLATTYRRNNWQNKMPDLYFS
jgi:hypothetical protein